MAIQYLYGLATQPFAWDDHKGNSIYTGLMNWANYASYVVDVTTSQQLIEDHNIQSLFVSNPTAGVITVTVTGTNFTLLIPAYTQGVYPIIASDRPVITFTSSVASGTTQAWITNVRCETGSSFYVGVPSSSIYVTENAGNVIPFIIGSYSVTGAILANNYSSGNFLTGSPGYAITGIDCYMSSSANFSTAGDCVIKAADTSNGLIWEGLIYLPGTSAPPAYPLINRLSTPPGFMWLSRTSASSMYIVTTNISGTNTAIQTGNLSYTVNYSKITFLGA